MRSAFLPLLAAVSSFVACPACEEPEPLGVTVALPGWQALSAKLCIAS